jgi:predicted  nucleic acid-binding Zn-ribbon protein
MEKDGQEHKQFLERQLDWCKKQDHILEEIEMKLHEMKKVAQYTLDHELTAREIDQLNGHLNELKREVHFLEKQLHSVVH